MASTIWEAIVLAAIKLLTKWIEGLKAHHAQLKAQQAQAQGNQDADALRTHTDGAVEQSHAQTDEAIAHIVADDDPAQRLRDSAKESADATRAANDQL